MLELNGYRYSKKSFDDYGFRARIVIKTVEREINFDIYTDDHNMIRVEDVLLERRGAEVMSLQILNWTTRQQDDASAEMIDEWLRE